MEIAKQNNRDDITAYTIASGTLQNSVVVKIGSSKEPGIVIGAHMDTYPAGLFDAKPGADDDGSGCMTVMGIARTLLQSGMHFKKPIYIIWYAAEEFGLIGSKAVVNHFIAQQIPVSAVLQFDMTGYAYQNEETMWLVTDYVNPALTEYLSKLITTYVKKDVKKAVDITQCGYACSDHAIWMKNKIPAAFPFETRFTQHNPTIHRSTDTMAILSSNHMADYAKLGLAFAVELAEPVE